MTGNARAPILVTGARGFLGSQIVAFARAGGRDTIAACRDASEMRSVALDVCDVASIEAAFRSTNPSHVIHCAAYGVNYADQDTSRAMTVNVQGALNVLAVSANFGVERFVHVGSCFEYGSHDGPIAEDAPLNPTAIYGSTKAAATLLMRERAQALGVPLLVVRPFGMWGRGEGAHRLIPQVIAACVNRTPMRLTACDVIRDYTYVEDMAANILTLTCVDHVATGSIVNLGTGQGVTLRDFVLSIARLFAAEDLMQFGALPYRPTEMRSLVADNRRMHQLLKIGACTPLAVGIRRTIAAADTDHGERELTRNRPSANSGLSGLGCRLR